MKGSPLIERGDDLARVEAALDEACNGNGSFLVVEAPAGMGKTALLRASRRLAEARGMRILRGRGGQLEQEFAFGVVRQLFEPALAGASAEERGELLDGAPGIAARVLGLPGAPARDPGETADTGDWSFAVLHGLYWLCANLSAGQPVCLVVDDAHWADVPSLRFLAFLLPRLEELPVALVVASREHEGGGSFALLQTITADSSADVVRLEPLSRTGVSEFVEAALRATPSPAFVDACLRVTRGTPFFLQELAVALQAEGLDPTDSSAVDVDRIGAPAIGRSIALRLARLPEPAVRLARALAVLEQGDLQHVAAHAGLSNTEAQSAADLLGASGFFEPGRRPLAFVHPIVRAGIYESLSADDRARAHRLAARLLAHLPGENERVAEHLLAVEPAGDLWSVERLVEAARAAMQAGAPENAAVYLRRALEEPPDAGEQQALLLDLGVAEAMIGVPSWRNHLEEAVRKATEDAARVDAAIILGLTLSRAECPEAAVDVFCRTANSLEPNHRDRSVLLEALATGVELANGVPVPEQGGSPRRRRDTRRRAAEATCASPEVLAVAGFVAALANEPAEACADLVHRGFAVAREVLPAETEGPWFAQATWFAWSAVTLLVTEHYGELSPILDAAVRETRGAGDSSRLAAMLGLRGWLRLRLGELTRAQTDTQAALAALELRAPALYRMVNAGVLVMALVDQGELDAAEEALDSLREVESTSLTAAILQFGRGRLRVAESRIDEGLADFLAVGRLTTAAQAVTPGFLPWRSEAALAHRLLGAVDEARALATEELELARAFGAKRTLGVALRAAGIVEGGPGGEKLLREAVAAHEEAGVKLDHARSLTELGALLRRSNKRSEARDVLRRALDCAHRLRARPLAERAETELRATGARPRRIVLTGLEALTASERRVAELAARNMTNREIAQRLFVTARTVEGHLTSVFRKLRISSRDELSAALAGDAPIAA